MLKSRVIVTTLYSILIITFFYKMLVRIVIRLCVLYNGIVKYSAVYVTSFKYKLTWIRKSHAISLSKMILCITFLMFFFFFWEIQKVWTSTTWSIYVNLTFCGKFLQSQSMNLSFKERNSRSNFDQTNFIYFYWSTKFYYSRKEDYILIS